MGCEDGRSNFLDTHSKSGKLKYSNMDSIWNSVSCDRKY